MVEFNFMKSLEVFTACFELSFIMDSHNSFIQSQNIFGNPL